MLVINAIVFGLPHQIWKHLEGGLIKNFYVMEANSAIISAQPKELRALVDRFTTYFRSLLGQNNKYFMMFSICEILNLVAVTVNFVINDKFLDGNFKSYGPDVLKYHSLSSYDQNRTINPMCDAFPTKVSCVLANVGLTGKEQVLQPCILYYYNLQLGPEYFEICTKQSICNFWIF
jgi:hypothetical protein